jgi:DNA-binding beta-propeller fold protein YncE
MRITTFLLGLVLLPLAAFCQSTNSQSPPGWPGRQADGSVLLPNMWSLRPAGQQVELGDFPVNIAVHPHGEFAAVLHAGYGKHEIVVVNLSSGQIASRTPVNEAFYGLEFSRDGAQLFCSGAGDETIHIFKFRDGQLGEPREITIRDKKQRGVPCGLVVDSKAQRLFVANVVGHRVTEIDFVPELMIKDIALAPDAAPISEAPVKPSVDADVAAATKRDEETLYENRPEDTYPYACRLDEKRQRLYVSLWAQSAVAVVDLKLNQVIARWPTEEHPCEMVLSRSGKWLFVANANRNTVTVLDTATGKALETIWAAFYPQSPPGATPNSLALSPDEKTLFVANANVNVVAVFDVSKPGKSRSRGFIPVGWYPTSVRVTPDGKHLLVANGKGISSKANPHGPQPGQKTAEYIAGLFRGTLNIIDLPSGRKLDAQLAAWTADAFACTPLKTEVGALKSRLSDNPIPTEIGNPSPIKYCIYIIKENRTYDQIFGDVSAGNGDPTLCLFPERVTPNHHKLVSEFVLLDNFYAEAEVSADGHEWSMGAYASDFVEKTWPLNYGHARGGKFPYPSEGFFPIAAPAGGYIWDRAKDAGVSYRSYGEFVSNGKTTNDVVKARVKNLVGHIDEQYRGFDVSYPDGKRADRFISELRRLEAEGEMPRLQIVRLGNDHTYGTTAGRPTPTACVADNDGALGRVVEAVSHSKFWAQTAIFIVEDDAQNGPDHVDAHRTVALVISPYTKRSAVDSTMYSTSSMLRTMELILGLKSMSQFDLAATPMFNSFQAKPDLRPYDALAANVDLQEKNPRLAWGSDLKMDFTREDAADDLLLNEAVWRSVRGADSAMPAPVHAAFVFVRATDGDGD